MSGKHRSTQYDHLSGNSRRLNVEAFCECGGATEAFAPDLVSCTICGRDYLIVRRARKAQLFPVKPLEEDDGWEAEVERALREA